MFALACVVQIIIFLQPVQAVLCYAAAGHLFAFRAMQRCKAGLAQRAETVLHLPSDGAVGFWRHIFGQGGPVSRGRASMPKGTARQSTCREG